MSVLRAAAPGELPQITAFLREERETAVLADACVGRVHPLYFELYGEWEGAELRAVFARLFGVWHAALSAQADAEQAAAFLNWARGKAELCGRPEQLARLEPLLHGVTERLEAPLLLRTGEMSQSGGEAVRAAQDAAALRAVHTLLADCGTFRMPGYEDFYLTRRTLLAKGLARTRGIWDKGMLLATASTLFESAGAAMLGAVATAPEALGAGLATQVVRALCDELAAERKEALIAAYHPAALHIYQKLGFVQIGTKRILRFAP